MSIRKLLLGAAVALLALAPLAAAQDAPPGDQAPDPQPTPNEPTTGDDTRDGFGFDPLWLIVGLVALVLLVVLIAALARGGDRVERERIVERPTSVVEERHERLPP